MIGQIVSHYKITEKLGEGGMGVVYKAEDTKLKRTVAMKFLRPDTLDDDEQKARFLREAQAAAALDHANICAVYEIDEIKGQTFIVMAYVNGLSLNEKTKSGALGVDEAMDIAVQVAEGIEAAHKRGIVHRDIKSANIMVTEEGKVKILDFGLAEIHGEGAQGDVISSAGTASYMSPEQARGEKADHRTDIWSLGVCMYEMLAGRAPFDAGYREAIVYSILNQDPPPLSELGADIPQPVIDIVEKAMQKDPADRFQSISDMLAALKEPLSALGTWRPGQRPSIAVLPFDDMSPEKDQGYFCDGIADEIINALTRVEGLDVVARTSSFLYKREKEDIREIGKRLGADAVLEGSVRKSGNRLRITAQIINVSDGFHVWSEQFDRELEDIFAIQDEIAQIFVQVMKVELSENEKRAMEKTPTEDFRAYDFYLRGRMYFYQSKRTSINFAIEMFTRATETDPGYALAYAGLADCYSYLHMYFERSDQNLANALTASQIALELDPGLAEAHAAHGLAVALKKQYGDAARAFEKAIELNPKLFEAYYFYARTSFAQGDHKKSAYYYEQACKVDPDNHQAPNLLGFTYRALGLKDKSVAAYKTALKNIDKRLALNPDDSRSLYLKSATLIELGRHEEGLEWADRAYALDPEDPYIVYGVACSYSRLERIEEAIDYFQKAVDCGFAHREWVENDVDFDPIRRHPRFLSILETME